MSKLQCLLATLVNEEDTACDIKETLEALAEILLYATKLERKDFVENNGFAAVMQLYTPAYSESCMKVLLAWLVSEEEESWPYWVLTRLVDCIYRPESLPQLRKTSLHLLLHASKQNKASKDVLFREKEAKQPLFENLLDLFDALWISWPLDELELLLQLIQCYILDASPQLCLGTLQRLMHSAQAVQLSSTKSQQLCQTRFQAKDGNSFMSEENKISCYTKLLKTLNSLLSKRNVCDLLSTKEEKNRTQKLISNIVKEMERVHEASPTKISRVLDWNGKLKSFKETKFPLRDSTGGWPLKEWIDITIKCLVDVRVAKWFYRSDLLTAMADIGLYEDELSQSLDFNRINRLLHKVACEEIVEDKPLAGLIGLLNCSQPELSSKGLDCLRTKIDLMSGNEFARFESSPLALQKVLHIYKKEVESKNITQPVMHLALNVIRADLERARRGCGLLSPHRPSTGPWKSIDDDLWQAINQHPHQTSAKQNTSTTVDSNTGSITSSTTDLKSETVGMPGKSETDEDGVRIVYDNGPSEMQKGNREEWKKLSLNEKVRWTQTTTDVLAWIRVPKGTKVKNLMITVEPQRLRLRLDWYGRVVDGPLHRRCKATEAIWVLEDDEVHFILPKDDPHFWKSLFKGGSEKSFMEIIQESVESDEASPSYDQLDDRSKELIENIKERQLMVHDGLIDLEGFDDFRIVVGENSL